MKAGPAGGDIKPRCGGGTISGGPGRDKLNTTVGVVRRDDDRDLDSFRIKRVVLCQLDVRSAAE